MFPFRGMPRWAQNIGEVLPLTHFLRVVRGLMLKGVELADVQQPLSMMMGFTVFVCVIAMLRYRRTLNCLLNPTVNRDSIRVQVTSLLLDWLGFRESSRSVKSHSHILLLISEFIPGAVSSRNSVI